RTQRMMISCSKCRPLNRSVLLGQLRMLGKDRHFSPATSLHHNHCGVVHDDPARSTPMNFLTRIGAAAAQSPAGNPSRTLATRESLTLIKKEYAHK
ncbi:hypothetical protein ACI1V7_28125, partial [Massilia sp. TN1-12]